MDQDETDKVEYSKIEFPQFPPWGYCRTNFIKDFRASISNTVFASRLISSSWIISGGLFSLIVYTMLSINVKLTLFVLAPLPIMSISIFFISKVIHLKSEKVQIQLSKLSTSVPVS